VRSYELDFEARLPRGHAETLTASIEDYDVRLDPRADLDIGIDLEARRSAFHFRSESHTDSRQLKTLRGPRVLKPCTKYCGRKSRTSTITKTPATPMYFPWTFYAGQPALFRPIYENLI